MDRPTVQLVFMIWFFNKALFIYFVLKDDLHFNLVNSLIKNGFGGLTLNGLLTSFAVQRGATCGLMGNSRGCWRWMESTINHLTPLSERNLSKTAGVSYKVPTRQQKYLRLNPDIFIKGSSMFNLPTETQT